MDRFSIIIERQEQLEALIKEWEFMLFFKNGIEGFSIEEMTPPELLFGDDFMNWRRLLYPLKTETVDARAIP